MDKIEKLTNFFNLVCGEENQDTHKIEIRYAKEGEHLKQKFFKSYKEASAFSLKQNGANVYFGVAPRKANASSGKKKDCYQLTSIFSDVDYGEEGHKGTVKIKTMNDAINLIQTFEHRPSVLVNSGHGLHSYWKLDEPVILDNDNIKSLENKMLYFIHNFGGDKGTHDISRILRVPYTYNCKPNCPQVEVTIL
jgi:hypothetical protein